MSNKTSNAINNAVAHLPEGFEIVISITRNSGVVSLLDPNGEGHDYPANHEGGVENDINAAVEYANSIC